MMASLLRLTAAMAIAALPFAAPVSRAQQGPDAPPPVVQVAPVVAQKMSETVTVPGSVVSRNDSQIAAEVAGVVDEVAEVGATIAKDGVIARIDPKLLQLEADRTAAAVKRLEAQVKYLDSQVDRMEALAGKGSGTRQSLDEARSQRDMAQQDLAAAHVARQQAQYNLEHAEVKSPFPGRVVTRLVQPGEYIERGKAVARIVDVGSLEVMAQIPIASVAQLKEGDSVSIEGPGRTVTAIVRALVPVGDQVSRAAEIRATLADATWLVGTAVKVATPTEPPHDVLAVPRDAVLLRPEGSAVYRIGADDTAELVPVKSGLSTGSLVAVTGSLQPGDRIVVRGAETLQPGQKVQVQARNGQEASTGAQPG